MERRCRRNKSESVVYMKGAAENQLKRNFFIKGWLADERLSTKVSMSFI